jgi:hypothetical protein
MRRAAVVLAACLLAAPAALAQGPVDVRVAVDHERVLFGDPFEARVDVVAGDPDDVQVTVEAGPFTPLGPPRVERRNVGDDVVVSTTQRLACLGSDCLPGRRPRTIELPPPVVRVAGQAVPVSGTPSIAVGSRVATSAIEAREPPLRRTTEPPPPAFAVAPGALTALLVTAAALFAATAAGLVLLEVRRARGRRPVDPLHRALGLLRQSAGRPPADRRRAADLLSRVLGDLGADTLARRASTLAWSPPQPRPDDAEALAGDAEQLTQVHR